MLHDLIAEHEDDDPIDLEQQPLDDPMIARRLLIQLAILNRDRARTKATLAAVQGEYQRRIQAADEREAEIRRYLQNYVTVNGSVSFPDAGGASLSKRKAHLAVADEKAFEQWAIAHGHVREVLDKQSAKEEADKLWETGELAPGLVLEQPDPSLTVRGVKP